MSGFEFEPPRWDSCFLGQFLQQRQSEKTQIVQPAEEIKLDASFFLCALGNSTNAYEQINLEDKSLDSHDIYSGLGGKESQRSGSIQIGGDYQLGREKKEYSPRENHYGGRKGSLFKPRRGQN